MSSWNFLANLPRSSRSVDQRCGSLRAGASSFVLLLPQVAQALGLTYTKAATMGNGLCNLNLLIKFCHLHPNRKKTVDLLHFKYLHKHLDRCWLNILIGNGEPGVITGFFWRQKNLLDPIICHFRCLNLVFSFIQFSFILQIVSFLVWKFRFLA